MHYGDVSYKVRRASVTCCNVATAVAGPNHADHAQECLAILNAAHNQGIPQRVEPANA